MAGKIPKKKDRPGIDRLGRTALHYAAVDKNFDEAKRLIGQGENVNARDDNDWTPLHFATQAGTIEIVKLLLQNGAEIDAANSSGATPLLSAVTNYIGDGTIIKMLRDAGANPNHDNRNGISPLYAARNFCSDLTRDCPASEFFTDLP